jgi:transposase
VEKKLSERVEQLRHEYPGAEIQLWAMDEHRVGLQPVLRRVWFPWWEVPIAKVQWRYQWVWVYGFVHPASGETYWWLMPRVNIQVFNQVLADFARHFGLGPTKQIVISIDQAGWHTSDKVVMPDGLHFEFLPPYSPELQPAERLWVILDEPIVNRCFETIEELEQVLYDRCRVLLKQQDFIRSLTQFHWWQTVGV